MRITFDQDIKNHMGDPIVGPDQKNITLMNICTNALLTADTKKAEDKLRRFKLSMKIGLENGEPTEVSAAEITEIQQCINEAYPSAMIYGAAHMLLEPEEEGE